MSSPVSPSGPPPGAAAPSQSSSTDSPTAEPGGLVADAGPAFDPTTPAPRLALPKADDTPPAKVKAVDIEDTIRGLLQAKGMLLHSALAVGPKLNVESTEWQYLDEDLEAIAPPLARIISRFPAAATAVAAGGDPIAVGMGFLSYGARSIAERQAVLAIAQQGARPAHVDIDPAATPSVYEDAAAGDDDDSPEVPPLAARGR
jgi:hypothetical protein